MPKTPPQRRALSYACVGSALLTLGAAASVRAASTPPAPTTSIVSTSLVKTPGHSDSYEICLYSSAGFPMSDTAPTLSIGPDSFLISRYVPNRPLDEIIFSLTPVQFASLKNGYAVAVYYAPDDAGNAANEDTFGSLETPLLPNYKP